MTRFRDETFDLVRIKIIAPLMILSLKTIASNLSAFKDPHLFSLSFRNLHAHLNSRFACVHEYPSSYPIIPSLPPSASESARKIGRRVHFRRIYISIASALSLLDLSPNSPLVLFFAPQNWLKGFGAIGALKYLRQGPPTKLNEDGKR